jgi:iron complex outermembrane recepter protein
MRRIHLLLAGAALALVTPGLAVAQDAPAATSEDEIIVTARKREERLQDVPIAVTAVTAEAIEREQINAVREIASITPGLNITTDSVGRSFLSIRGVGTTLIESVQPGVGIFLDGIYQPNTSYLNNPVVDIERIEVLRGPQGTLFGNNTLGGAINVITRAPTDDFSGRFSASYADPDNYQTVAGSVSGPLVEGVLRGRLAASYHSHDGFSTNVLTGADARPLENQSVNGTLIWDAPQDAKLTLNAYWDEVEGQITAYSSPSGSTDYIDDVALNADSIATFTYYGANLRGVFDFTPNTQMTAILAYDYRKGQARGDGDFGPIPFVRVIDGNNHLNTYTGELRFDTQWNDRLSTLIGVFASSFTLETSVLSGITVPTGLPPPAPPFVEISPPPTRTSTDTTQQAIYINAFYDITPTLEFTGGIRFDRQQVTTTSTGTYEANEPQPRFTLTQHLSDDHIIYASIARGFRGGGANVAGGPLPIYQGDSVWTYEIGDKFSTENGALTLNTAIYFNDYENYIGQNGLTPPPAVAVNLNTGDVESYGVEIEGTWRASDIFSLQGGVAYNHARIVDDSQFRAVFPGGLATDLILFQPDWNFFLTPTLTIPVGQGDIMFNTTVSYKGDRAGSSLSPTFQPQLEGYYLVNGNLAYQINDWTFALWGTNLTDEEYFDSFLDESLLGAIFDPLNLGGNPFVHNLGIKGDGRRVGVRVSARF